jgi:hypothetical protein
VYRGALCERRAASAAYVAGPLVLSSFLHVRRRQHHTENQWSNAERCGERSYKRLSITTMSPGRRVGTST